MKLNMHFWGLVLLLTCCSFAKEQTHKSAIFTKHNIVSFSKEKNSSSTKSVFFKVVQTSETSINQLGANTLTFSFEEPSVKPFITNKILEQFIKSQFYQYTNTDKNFLVLSRKSHLIFPFHYHW